MNWEVLRDHWHGRMSLIARISGHSQQICGLAWSPGGQLLASGGNDNLCCLFDVQTIIGRTRRGPTTRQHLLDNRIQAASQRDVRTGSPRDLTSENELGEGVRALGPECAMHFWSHQAAVKAIAFCPWSDRLIATGGGSNDKCIHFFRTSTGSALATISVDAQVTSLIWSTTRREIAATFGYAHPEHPYRIAIFSWPECSRVAAIPWDGQLRALYAVAYPGGIRGAGDSGNALRTSDGSIVVAASDETVKFYDLWPAERKDRDVQENMLGFGKGAEVIR
ncbi:hypothetical protein HIM_08600 [Hirsutella minnesotensis 3608]|uniref:Uncharacterized protein n=1 Tax=Hirsutella minnesotensis 3608 TaxID=1043627 RepID=A0A0F8A3L5_9HYPO|nr:hypothetical protein HIM_08600 [Hirsutella minnesotensis 3608]